MPGLRVTNVVRPHKKNGRRREIDSHRGQQYYQSGVSYKYPIPLKVALAASSLIDPYFEISGQLFFIPKIAVEIKTN